jgi:hypothetical protein
LFLKRSKCSFGERSVAYLGHVISAKGVAMDEQKVRAVLDWPLPQSVCAVRAFLGLVRYYRRFLKNYGAIAMPLTALLKKDAFKWSAEVETMFWALQHMLPNLDHDASGTGLSAVLHQGGGPVAFLSRQLAPRHTKLTTAYERELLGLDQAVRQWRPYLWGWAFVIKTDHFILKFLLDQRLATIPQHQWANKLIGFDLWGMWWWTHCLTATRRRRRNWWPSWLPPSPCSTVSTTNMPLI